MSPRESSPSSTSHENEQRASFNVDENVDHTPSASAVRRLVEYSDSEEEESRESAGGLASREPQVQEDLCGSSIQDVSNESAVQNGPLPPSAYASDSLFIPMEENVESTEDAIPREENVESNNDIHESDEIPFGPFDDEDDADAEPLSFENNECPSKIIPPSVLHPSIFVGTPGSFERLSSSKRSAGSKRKHASETKHISKNTRPSAHKPAHTPKGTRLAKLDSAKRIAPAIEYESASTAKRALPAVFVSAKRRAPSAELKAARAAKRARKIKARVEQSLMTLKPSDRASRVLSDPENHAIKRMRQDDKMEFTAIAEYLNKERAERGEPQIMTAASVYSRFVRNCPRIAAAQGETGFDTKDYMFLRNPQKHPAAELPGAVNNPSGFKFGGNGARKRPSDAERAEKELANNVRHMVAGTLSEQKDMVAQPEMTEALMGAVEGVTDRFWDYVASTMEAKTGKLFDKNVLKSRYNTFKW